MSAYWSSLRPLEKRVVVGAGVIFFVVLNVLFVLPRLSEVNAMYARLETANRTVKKYQAEFAQTNAYAQGLRDLDKASAMAMPAEEQSFQFANAIQAEAGRSKVEMVSNGKIMTLTNQFFLEKSQPISVQATETNLVNFLFNLGSGGSLIRVRDLGLRPDPARQQLLANVKLVASYQKNTPAKPASPAAPAPGARPAAAQSKPAAAPIQAGPSNLNPPVSTSKRS